MKKILLTIIFIVIVLILGIKQTRIKDSEAIPNAFGTSQLENVDNSHIITLNTLDKNVVEENNYNDEFDINNVRVSIKENSLDENGLVLIIENNNPSGFYYYPNFELEKYVDNKWQYFVMGHQSNYDEDEISVSKNSTIEINILFKDSYLNENKEK